MPNISTMHEKMSEELQGSKAPVFSLNGQRITRQRLLLLDLIRRGGHLNADELYRKAKEIRPDLSLSTVYRNLRLFIRLGLINEVKIGTKGHRYYEVRGAIEHYHLVCLSCGRVVEFQCPLAEQLKSKVGQESGFYITGIELSMEGYCPSCKT